jgi:uncharacterized membrane protein YeaQ/YmgE (transglycosylase-associated protein family)
MASAHRTRRAGRSRESVATLSATVGAGTKRVTGELFLAAVSAGLLGGWLVGLVIGTGAYGLLSDLSLGLIGGSIAVWIYQAVGLGAYAGTIGGILAAFMGAVSVVLAQRKVRYPGR